MTGPEDAEPEYDEDNEPVYGEAFDDEDYTGDEDESADYAPLAPVPVAEPVVAAPAPRDVRPAKNVRVPSAQAGRRAAFTLRLDADRHLKLRLAATMQGVSAQALVTEALDRLLAEYDELDVIANHLKRH